MKPDYDDKYPYFSEMDFQPYRRALLTAMVARISIVFLVTFVGSRFIHVVGWNRLTLIFLIVFLYGMLEWAEFLTKTRRSRYDPPVD
jgi:hypothetical protein